MATVGGLSSSTSSGVNMYGASIKGFGGLATGMDTDSMIEGMTLGTRTKIQELLKKKDKYQWQTDAYRSVSDALVNFSKKYLDITNSNSPYRASFFDKNLATAGGANSSKVSVTGVGSLLDKMKILAVNNLAKDANLVSKGTSSNRVFSTGSVDFTNDLVEPKVGGGTFTLDVEGELFVFDMTQGQTLKKPDGTEFKADYTTTAGIEEAINAKMSATKMADGTTLLSDKIQFSYDGTNKTFSLTSTDPTSDVSIIRGSTEAMKTLGFMDDDGKLIGDGKLTGGKLDGAAIDDSKLNKVTPFAQRFADKTMSFSFNGITKTVKLPSKEEWEKIAAGDYEDELGNKLDDIDALAHYMQKKLDSAYGSGKVTVTGDSAKGLVFGTTSGDNSAVFKLTDADNGVVGEDNLLNIDYGVGNRLNLNSSLAESGLLANIGGSIDANGKLYLEINGTPVEGLTADSTINEVMTAINKSGAGVKVSYLETADRFTLTSTIQGAAGRIQVENEKNPDGVDNFALKLFGQEALTEVRGVDSEMVVEYEGGVQVTVKRGSNSFTLDGTTFTLNEEFGEVAKDSSGNPITDADGNPVYSTRDAINFTTSVDADKITKTIATMIEDYNKIIDNVQNLVGTKPDRDYGPLTEDEKAQLSESQIEKLENKAKEGILFNDSLLRGLSDKLRTVFSGAADIGTLKAMGITVGTTYKDGGKINFDETKFKSALQADPDKVKTLFTKASTEDDAGGITARLKSITDMYAKDTGATKGLLIEKAGSQHASTSLLKNSLKTLMDEIDADVKQLKKKLQTEIDRYTKQFTSLEQLVAQMNSQSSWLSSVGG